MRVTTRRKFLKWLGLAPVAAAGAVSAMPRNLGTDSADFKEARDGLEEWLDDRLDRLDTFACYIIAGVASTPPSSASAGATYIVGESPTGSWSSFAEHDLAYYHGGTWRSRAPITGDMVYHAATRTWYRFAGSWVVVFGEWPTNRSYTINSTGERVCYVTPGTAMVSGCRFWNNT